MRIGIPSLFTAVAAATLVAVAPVAPAGAGTTHSISVSPTDPQPGDTVTVTGTSDCPSSGYTVTLAYEGTGGPATATATGTTDAAGEYTQPLTIPDTAVAGEEAEVTSAIASCDGGGAANSNQVVIDIEAHDGTLAVTPTSGDAGTQVTINGTNCYGGEVFVGFTDGDEFGVEVEPVTLNPDRTFSATFTIPAGVDPGQYFFVAECPGTDFEAAPFTVTGEPDNGPPPGPGNPPPPAPPAVPVPGVVDFTG